MAPGKPLLLFNTELTWICLVHNKQEEMVNTSFLGYLNFLSKRNQHPEIRGFTLGIPSHQLGEDSSVLRQENRTYVMGETRQRRHGKGEARPCHKYNKQRRAQA